MALSEGLVRAQVLIDSLQAPELPGAAGRDGAAGNDVFTLRRQLATWVAGAWTIDQINAAINRLYTPDRDAMVGVLSVAYQHQHTARSPLKAPAANWSGPLASEMSAEERMKDFWARSDEERVVLVQRMIDDPDPGIREDAARGWYPLTDPQCDQLSTDPAVTVLRALAGRWSNPPNVKEVLAAHTDVDVRIRLVTYGVRGPGDRDLFERLLFEDVDPRVRVAAVKSWNLDMVGPDLRLRIATRGDVEMRREVAQRVYYPDNGSEDHLQAWWVLMADSDVVVRQNAARYGPGEITEMAAVDADGGVRLAAAGNPRVTLAAQRTLLDDHDLAVVRALAGGEGTAAEIRDSLAKHSDLKTRIIVAKCPWSPASSLWVCLADPAPDVRNAAQANLAQPRFSAAAFPPREGAVEQTTGREL